MDPDLDTRQLTVLPPTPSNTNAMSPSTSKPNHSRDPSLQQILHQFDPLAPPQPSADGKDERPVPPPKDNPSPSPVSPTRPEVPEKDHHVADSSRATFTLKRRASILSIEKPPPAEPDQPFEFQRFLEQMRHKSADGVARYMKSFLQEFNKRSWTVSEQQKIVHDFLNFIANKIPLYEPWANASQNELSNALEGMEKLIMNRLYSRTFAPAALATVTANQPYIPGSPKVSDEARERLGDLMDDVERDRILSERIEIFDWVGPPELDIPDGIVEGGEKFLQLAEQELLKINNYRAPRDKVICILNSSKVLFGLIRQSHLVNKDLSADTFLPLLILLLLRANPPQLYSNIQYIQRFRSPERLGGEGGYYLNSLEAAVGWIESIEKGVLSCSEEDFDRNVELAVSRIADRHRLEAETLAIQSQSPPSSPKRNSTPQSILDRTSRLALPTSAATGDRPEILGPTRDLLVSGSGKVVGAVRKPLRGFGNFVFGDGGESPPTTPAAVAAESGRRDSRGPSPTRGGGEREEEAAVRLANAEIERAERAEREQRGQTLEMLTQMFPDLDSEVVEAVIVAKEGRIGVCIDICLEMSSGIQTPASDLSKIDAMAAQTNALDTVDEEGQQGVETSDLLGLGMSELNLDLGDQKKEKSAGELVNLLD